MTRPQKNSKNENSFRLTLSNKSTQAIGRYASRSIEPMDKKAKNECLGQTCSKKNAATETFFLSRKYYCDSATAIRASAARCAPWFGKGAASGAING